MVTEGELNENTRDSVVGVEILYDLGDLGRGRLCREGDMAEGDADLGRGLGLHADIRAAVGPLARLDDSELGRETGELGLLGRDPLSDVGADRSESK
jgi:hypothetical protein